jgi:hypothetical protein
MASAYEQLKAVTANLAASAEQQDRHLSEQGFDQSHGNDELALEFDDAYRLFDAMLSDGELTRSQREALRPLDALLSLRSQDSDAGFWKRDALWTNARWEEVRRVAADAFRAFA